MKKLLTTLSVCLLATASLLAQGRINFANTSAAVIRITDGLNTAVLGTASTAQFGIGPASVRIQLLAGLTSTSLAPVLIGTAANQLYVTNTASSIPVVQGTFSGGTTLPLPGYDGSVPVFFQMSIQSINGLYSSLSPIISVTPTLSPDAAAPMFGPAPNMFGGGGDMNGGWSGNFFIIAIPEPSTLALAGMSFSVMFLARRRK